MIVIAYALSLLVILYYIYGNHRNAFTVLGWKTLSSLCFLTIGAILFASGNQAYGAWMITGLILGLFGDVFLNLAPCYPKKEALWFLLGLGSFLLGHLAYVYALYRSSMSSSIVLLLGCTLIAFTLLFLLQKNKLVDLTVMFVPAFVYAAVILFFEAQCLLWLIDQINLFTIVLNIGSILFVVSDLILLFILFGKRNSKWMTKMNLSTYYLAQLCLATTILLYQA